MNTIAIRVRNTNTIQAILKTYSYMGIRRKDVNVFTLIFPWEILEKYGRFGAVKYIITFKITFQSTYIDELSLGSTP